MSLETLVRVLPPPAEPAAAPTAADWEQFEAGPHGLTLPPDYKAFLSRYGCGTLYGMNRVHDLLLWSPFPDPGAWRRALERTLALDRSVRETIPKDYGAHVIYPELGGLLPFGTTGNAQTLYWRTAGPPEQWTVAAYEARSGEPVRDFPESATSFLYHLVSKRGYCPPLSGYASRKTHFQAAAPLSVAERLRVRPA